MNFNEMNLKDFELTALNDMGFTTPTDIQSKTIPLIMEKKDVLGKSKTGSGKTFAYGLPIINNLETFNNKTQALIVAPTRELAEQICKELVKLTHKNKEYSVVPVYGGVSMQRQLQELRRGARIVVGTPGRIMDHLRRKTLNLVHIKTLVLDEADEMLNMGFKEDIETILQSANDTHQTVMFSATMPAPILAIAKNYMKDPILVEINEKEDKLDITEQYVSVGAKDKQAALREILVKFQPKITIVFTNTKRNTEQLAESLKKDGYNAQALNGDMRQSSRRRVMNSFKSLRNNEAVYSREPNVLVATDVAARGIDINDVDLVVNYDIPNDEEFYTHRIGRTGRGNKSGRAVSIANTEEQVRLLKQLGRKRKTEMSEIVIDCTKAYTVAETETFELRFPVRRKSTNSAQQKSHVKTGDSRKYSERSSSDKNNSRKFYERRNNTGKEVAESVANNAVKEKTTDKPFVRKADLKNKYKNFTKKSDKTAENKPILIKNEEKSSDKDYSRSADSKDKYKPFTKKYDEKRDNKPFAKKSGEKRDNKPYSNKSKDNIEIKVFDRKSDKKATRKPFFASFDKKSGRKSLAKRQEENSHSANNKTKE